MEYKIEKILTDSPFLDELIYLIKQMALNVVLKNQQVADDNETLESLKSSAIYLACKDGIVNYSTLEYTKEMLETILILNDVIIEAILRDKGNIVRDEVVYMDTNGVAVPNRLSSEQQTIVIAASAQYYIDNYVEYNSYYRELNGEPPYGDPGITVYQVLPDFIAPDTGLDETRLRTIPIHLLEGSEIILLEKYNVISDIISMDYNKYKYLDFLSTKKIDYYTSRKASIFDVLHVPTITNITIYNRFKEKLTLNRHYTTKVIYSEAYKYNSSYYDAIMMVFIICQTIIDTISEIQEIITNKEILDIRSIQFILESYGIPYFPEIPEQYQIGIVKRMNDLLKYKGTARNITDILAIFGFDDIEIFKYYLVKNPRKDDEGNYITTGPLDERYDLNFMRVPIDETNPDSFLKQDEKNIIRYEDIIIGDETWNGGLPTELVKQQIIEQDFNYTRSKYIAINTMYQMSELSFQIPYFYNSIFDENKVADNIFMKIEAIDPTHDFRLPHVFVALFSLGNLYYNFNDDIITSATAISHILGFNFDVDLPKLKDDLKEAGYDFYEMMDGNDFVIETNMVTFDQLFNMLGTNEKTLEFIKNKMINASDKHEYDAYNKLYNAFMIREFTLDYFKVNGLNPATGVVEDFIPETYRLFLYHKDKLLFNFVDHIYNLLPDERGNEALSYIDRLITALYVYIDSAEYKYIFSQFPGGSTINMMASYIRKVIDFFKSYNVDFLSMSVSYDFTDRFNTGTSYIDSVNIDSNLTKSDYYRMPNVMNYNSKLSYDDKYDIYDAIEITPVTN